VYKNWGETPHIGSAVTFVLAVRFPETFFCWKAPPSNYLFVGKYFPQQPLFVWYEKLTLTLDFVIFRVWVFARIKPTKVFVKYLWQNLAVRSLSLSNKKKFVENKSL
jgi:hypothetical protein